MDQSLQYEKSVVICIENQLVWSKKQQTLRIPPNEVLAAFELTINETRMIEGQLVLSCTPQEVKVHPEYEILHGKALLEHLPKEEQTIAIKALQWSQWQARYQYCTQCGGALLTDSDEMRKHCLSCGAIQYPVISPAVITLVYDGPRILLARSPHQAKGRYSLIAGFPEMGESCEAAVIREVKEETGLDIKDPQYFKSQSWPFPDRLMMGFTAQYAGGNLDRQTEELEALAWFHVDSLPELPFKSSIAYEMIQHYCEQYS